MDRTVAHRTIEDKALLSAGAAKLSQQPFRLLDLPAEVRNIIYDDVIHEFDPDVYEDWNNLRSGVAATSLANQQLRSEILSLLYDSKPISVHIFHRSKFNAWMDKWEPGLAQHFRHIKLQGYQHFRYRRPRRHEAWCESAIKIDLRQGENPVTYSRYSQCEDCPVFDESATRVESVVMAMEQVNGKRQLTKQCFLDILQAAAWEVLEDDVVLGREGNEGFYLRT